MIKALIFDAGGVLFNSGEALFKGPVEYISQVTSQDFVKVDKAYRETIVECESRPIDKEGLWDLLMSKLGKDIPFSGQDPIADGFKRFRRFNEVFTLIEKLKLNYKVAVVSNANAVEASTREAQGMYKYFDVVVLSFQVGVRKPHPKIYETAFEKLEARPEETVFIDNAPVNVEEAKKLGMIGVLFVDASELAKDLNQVGIRF